MKDNIEITSYFADNMITINNEFYTIHLNKDQIVDWETFAYMRQIGFNVISLDMEKMELTFENINKRFVYKGLNK
jgi:hypothetical protein